MKNWFVLTTLLLAGCAFSLGHVQPNTAKAPDQQLLDTSQCKDEARIAADRPGAFATEFLLGATLIGAPVGVGMDHNIQRKAFSDCMGVRGYTVTKDY